MGTELFFLAVILLAAFAAFDLIVGVSNDAVNFLSSAIGARVAPRFVILIIATAGILAGVTFSSGMMEVARKGIFHPSLFTMPELITIFLAVMITDVILLDLFSTFGLPTSTTVSIVFELLGAAVAISMLKIIQASGEFAELAEYINTGQALVIVGSILLSVVVAFVCGAVVQLATRMLFTFDYATRLKRYGALWGGVAMASITYFILVKGAKGASFMDDDAKAWIAANTILILLASFSVSALLLQLLQMLGGSILKPIVLIGTFALAMAFAANDLVNFIGVPMAGYHAYEAAISTDAPLSVTMNDLGGKVPTQTFLLLAAGAIMAVTLCVSRKARTVTDTGIDLGQQEEGVERFESTFLSRKVVRAAINVMETTKRLIPGPLRAAAARRLDTRLYETATDEDSRPSFDMLRAAVNLMVAGAVISYATSYKLPLSTTYVTFMVAMGTSFADQAWGRESAVYRVTGVLTVIGGWFMTAFAAFTVSCLFAVVIYYGEGFGVAALVGVATVAIWKNRRTHQQRAKSSEMDDVFNLKKVTGLPETISTTFEHTALLLQEIRQSLDATLEGLFKQNHYVLAAERSKSKKIQRWANIIVANVFKAMRLVQREGGQLSYKYGQTIRRLQKLADGHRDIVERAYAHVSNHHAGLLDVQIEELRAVIRVLQDILVDVEAVLDGKSMAELDYLTAKDRELRNLADRLHERQMERIRDGSSKTRLSVLYYAILGNAMMLCKQNVRLLEIFSETFADAEDPGEFDMD